MSASSAPLVPFVLVVAAFVGGALNAVAGGGSFITLPALLYAGVSPVSANATSAFALWPASIASVVAYRQELTGVRAWMARLGAISLLGGLLGGILLVRTSDESFMRLLPWLMLLAAVTFTFGGRITLWLRARRNADAQGIASNVRTQHNATTQSGTAQHRAAGSVPLWALLLQMLIAIYGGYFGGGMGIMMLAGLAVAGMTDMHVMNGLKSVLAVAINGIALTAFLVDGTITWGPGFVMMAGGIVGGYVGAALARRTAGASVRAFVLTIAWAMTTYFFVR